jgi:O-antigen/teichoic acid export membrane protein
VLRALGALTTALFKAVGRPDIPARHHWRMVLCTAILLVPLIEIWGIVGAAIAVLVPNFVIHWLRYCDVAMVLGIRQERILERLQGPVIAGAVMGAAMAAVCVATASWWPGWTLLGAGVTGAATYLGAIALIERAGRSTALRSAWLLARGVPA